VIFHPARRPLNWHQEADAMPLRDHFHGPLTDRRSWEELHGAWPGVIAFRLNAILPTDYYSGVRVRLGTAVEIDIGTFEGEDTTWTNRESDGVTALAWKPASPTLLLESETPAPPEYEVRVYDLRHARQLVAAVELVSPGNKDRPDSRDAFVSKCQALLQQNVCVTIVDVFTERSSNLYAELAERLSAAPPATAGSSIYAVSCRGRSARGRWRVESWEHELAVGSALPTLPLWLTEELWVPLELDTTYEDTCRGLRIS
jgi:Protein of unknown function (DUF4058)